jgi:hypothetical protein
MFKSNLLPYAYDVFSAHFNVLAVEYRGSVTDRTYYVSDYMLMREHTRYPGNKGRPSEKGTQHSGFTVVY